MRAHARGGLVAILGVTSTLSFAGCSLLVGDDSLTGHVDEAGADGNASSSDANDGGASPDATTAPDTGTSFCAALPNPKICSDFEHGGDLTGWTVLQQGGTVTGPSGSPLALELDVGATTGGDSAVGLQWATVGTGSKLVATELVEIVTTPKEVGQSMQTLVAEIRNQNGAWYETHVVITATRQLVFDDDSSLGAGMEHPLGVIVTPGWHRISLTTYSSSSGPRADVQLDDAAPIGIPISPNVPNPNSTAVSFGVAYLEGVQSGWKARLGGASVELEP